MSARSPLRELRRRLLSMRCQSCACRRGTLSSQCEDTRDDLTTGRAAFRCHVATEGPQWRRWTQSGILDEPRGFVRGFLGGSNEMAPCAGAVARYGTEEQVRYFLAHAPEVRDAYVGLTEDGPCGHHHDNPVTAWACARAAAGDGFSSVGKVIAFPSVWMRLNENALREVEAATGERPPMPPFWSVLDAHASDSCVHVHLTAEAALHCLWSSGNIRAEVRYYAEWPWRSYDCGTPIDEQAVALSMDFEEDEDEDAVVHRDGDGDLPGREQHTACG